jgi:hypothetical protein
MGDAWYDKANDGVNGAAQAESGAHGMYDMYKAFSGPAPVEGNDLLRPFGLNYDAPEVGAPAATMGESALGVGEGVLGMAGGALQFASGAGQAFGADAKESDHFDGGLNMLGGAASFTAGGLGTAAALGLGGAGVAAASSVAAPVAAAIGLGVAGDQAAENMHLWGKDADGNYQGSVEAAWNEGQHLGDEADKALGGGTLGLVGGAATAGLSTVGLETGAAVADVGLGVDALGASSGLFGSTANADGVGTHKMGAFEAMDHLGKSAGNGVDSLLGLDPHSTAGTVVGDVTRGAIDIAEAPLALAADAAGGIVGGAKALWNWL